MIDTSRIRTGFDVELNLGAGWFRTALQALADAGRLIPADAPPPFGPDSDLIINSVEILFGEARDLLIDATVDEIPVTLRASLALQEGDDGAELAIDTDIPGTSTTIPFDALDDVVGVPILVKVPGSGNADPSFAVLANLDIQAGPQSEDPLPAGEHVPRGQANLAQSFLPAGRDMALGIGREAFPRFANDAWHTDLRADDGSHPLPDDENRRGSWTSAEMEPRKGKFRLTLRGRIPIDVLPDGEVTVTVDIKPRIENGALTFNLSVDTDIDTGLLGDLFAAATGGLAGLILGPLTGGALGGAILGVTAIEVAEVIINGKVRKQVRAGFQEDPPTAVLACDHDDVIVEAVAHPDDHGGVALGPLAAIPRSIVIEDFRPDLLHTQFVLVTTDFEEIKSDGSGFGAAGTARAADRFVPRRASLLRREVVSTGGGGARVELVYVTTDPDAENDAQVEVRLPFDEVVERAEQGALRPPLELRFLPAEADITLLDGRVPSVCLRAMNVRRRDTIVTHVKFSTGLELPVPEAVRLQDAGAIVVQLVQLIHPSNAKPYFRAFADGNTEDNFENLTPF
jgi:hypothetical protein